MNLATVFLPSYIVYTAPALNTLFPLSSMIFLDILKAPVIALSDGVSVTVAVPFAVTFAVALSVIPYALLIDTPESLTCVPSK